MAVPVLKPSATGGEISPSLFGRLDLAKVQNGLSVGRNVFISYRGGASSRAGTALVGKALQAASVNSVPPRIIKFQFNIYQAYVLEFGDGYMRVIVNGGYVLESAKAITAASQANPCEITSAAHGYSNGDWVFISSIVGMTALNGRTFIIGNVTANTFTLFDIFGNPVNSLVYSAYVSGGTVARIYTNRQPPYAAVDLPYLKVVQSADVMSLCCINQATGKEYPTYDLTRLAANNWNFDALTFESAIAAPATCSATATVAGAPATQYAFCVTAVDANGEESVASPIAYVTNSVNIATTAGSLKINWAPVAGAVKYLIYKAPPSYDAPVPVGSQFGYLGQSFGTEFVDTNILQDLTKTPPLHLNPFARGQILSVAMTAGGAAYVQASTTATAVSATGSGAVLRPVVVGGAIVAVIVENGGELYQNGDTVTFADGGGGAGATGTLNIGPQTGTYPGVVSYFQQRRCYGFTFNNPDTYYLSQPGYYLNFDASNPPIDSDAVTGTPWGLQVNGVQWFQPMPGGLLIATGEDLWQLSGAASAGAAVTPSSQSAAAQESNGFSPTVQPIKVNQDIVYVSSFGYSIYDMQYNFYNNIYAANDISVMSAHLFVGYSITSWGWALNPSKLLWATRDDGKFLSCTMLKEQEVIAWTRHDTNGLVVGNTVVDEPPIDAPYFIVKRYVTGRQQWAYFIERMDNRIWQGPESPWCVDCGLALEQPAPDATLSASAATGSGEITGGYIATGGAGYTAPSGRVIDPMGTGSGGTVTFTQTGGVITGFAFTAGHGYSPGTYVEIVDPNGSGATFIPFIAQSVIFSATSAVFAATQIGDIIRIGGGKASVTALNSSSQVVADIIAPILQTMPNDPNRLPVPAPPGKWTITRPVTTITNLDHLEGMGVAVLADGVVVAGGDAPLMIVVGGMIELPFAASAVIVGLPFTAQYQALYFDIPGMPTAQGRAKRVSKCTYRLEASRGVEGGVDQPVASTLDFQPEIEWTNMQPIPDQASINAPNGAIPLFTGDKTIPLPGAWQNAANGWEASPCFIAAQQRNPLPMNVLAVVPSLEVGDTPG
jgi:hypothetical protein